MKKIFYLGFYDTVDNKAEKRDACLAATNKMTYIVSALEKARYEVELFSASHTKDKKNGYKGKSVKLGNHSTLVLFRTLPWGNKFQKLLSILNSKYQLYKYVIKNIGKNDTLIVYHSAAYAKTICTLKRLKKFKLVLELEEIYSDIEYAKSNRTTEFEIINSADAYIFPTELLNDKVNNENKPYTVIYGTYNVEDDRKSKFDDDKIHVVYAGVFALDKGVMSAIKSAKYLDSNYHVHILGFGRPEDVEKVKETVDEISMTSKCKITYEGTLTGEEYIRFIQSCHIGLSPQNNRASFNETSFPSKVLSYLSNGLRVVSVRIKSIEKSSVSNLISFYDEDSPIAIAQAIQKIDFNDKYNSRVVVEDLSNKFIKEIDEIVK